MICNVVYSNENDRKYLEQFNFPVIFNFYNLNTASGLKAGRKIKGHWGSVSNPFIEVLDDNSNVLRCFYSENSSAIFQFIKYLQMQVLIKKLRDDAVIPTYKHVADNGRPNDMGMDITCVDYEYDPKYDRFMYHTGLAFKLPEGYGMLIFPRSSNTKTESYLPNSVGILDSTYTGELMFCYKLRTSKDLLFPNGDKELSELEIENELAPYKIGDKIGQIVILPYPTIEFLEVTELPKTDRGEDGGINRTDKNFKV